MSDAEILIPRELLRLWLAFGDELPLPPETRRYMETRFRADLRDVRVHVGALAARLCDTLKVRALTLGNHILFADGEFEPASVEGKWLLAHELVHVLQQRSADGGAHDGLDVPAFMTPMQRPSEAVSIGAANDPYEDEADRLAVEVLDGGLRSGITPDRSGAVRGTRRAVDSMPADEAGEEPYAHGAVLMCLPS